MGYRLQPKVYSLKFEDHPGLEVTARSVSVEELITILKLADAMTGTPDEKQIQQLFGWFMKRVVGWNLEGEDGKPVPATVKGLLGQDFDFALMLIMAWVQAISSVRRPLVEAPAGTGNGTAPGNPLEASIPMSPMPASASGT